MALVDLDAASHQSIQENKAIIADAFAFANDAFSPFAFYATDVARLNFFIIAYQWASVDRASGNNVSIGDIGAVIE